MIQQRSVKTTYGYSLFVGFHIVRAVIFRCLWLHRNDIRFHELPANIYDVQAKVLAVVNLLTEWFSRDLLDRRVSHSSFTMRQLHTIRFLRLRQFRPPEHYTVPVAPISSAHISYACPPFTSTCAVLFLDLNFALSGYGGSNLDPFYGYGLDPNSPTKMSIPYFWLYIWVLSIPGWNLAKYFGLLPLAVTLRVWRLALLLRLLLAAYPFLGISLRLQLALLAFGFWVFFH